MASPYTYGTRSAETAILQQKLTVHDPRFDTHGVDGIFGKLTRDAVQAAQEFYAISPADGVPRADLLLELGITAPAVRIPKPSIFSSFATIGDILALLKGRTMTTDQITGIVRLVLGLIAGYFVTKGIGSQSLWDWISAGVLTAIPAIWSWYSNRPKVILPISQK